MATTIQPADPTAFQMAIDSFKARSKLTDQDIQDFEATSLTDLQKAISRIQESQKTSKKMMHLNRLRPFLEAMEQYGDIIGVFVNTCDILAYVWGPMKFLLCSLSNFNDAFSALLDGYQKIGKSLPTLMQYSNLLQDNEFLKKALVPLFEDVLEFHTVAVSYFRQKTWKTVFQSTWNHVNKKIAQLSNSLEQQKLFFESALQLQQYQNIHEFRIESQRAYQRLEADRRELQTRFESIDRDAQFQQQRHIQQWLGALDWNVRHESLLQRRHPGTGQWLLNNPRFKNWFALDHCSDALLWLSGKPGAGKSVLSSFVIEEIKRIPDANVLFFHSSLENRSNTGFLSIAKALCSQALDNDQDILLPFLCEKASSNGGSTLSSTELAKQILEVTLKARKNTYIVIDGLDEDSRLDRKEIVNWFQQIVHSIPTNELGSLRCLFVCQEDGIARKDLSSVPHITITAADNKEDIRLFSLSMHSRIEEKFGNIESSNYDIVNRVTDRAEGMFLYARLVLDNLLAQTSKRRLEQELAPNLFPKGLEEAYDRIIQRLLDPSISSARQTDTLQLLGWLTCAKRSLLWYEIQAAASVNTDTCQFDPERRFVEDSKDICASLVDIDVNGRVTLVHATTKEFLIRYGHVKPAQVDIELATRCLIYLNLDDFDPNGSDIAIEASLLRGTHAFVEYAICYWGQHIEEGLTAVKDSNTLQSDIELLCECLEVFIEKYWQVENTSSTVVVPERLRSNVQRLASMDRFEEILLCIAALKSALRPLGKDTAIECMLSIHSSLKKFRIIFESSVTLTGQVQWTDTALRDLYGDRRFKCSRLNCQYFHDGFCTLVLREQHLDKHNRSYVCSIQGCPQSLLGCTTRKELEKHMSTSHGIHKTIREREFPDAEEDLDGGDSPNVQSFRAKFQCNLCPKRFTRNYNLQSHLRTHTNDRPFECTVCTSSFTRDNDRKRHEQIHPNESGLKRNSVYGRCVKPLHD